MQIVYELIEQTIYYKDSILRTPVFISFSSYSTNENVHMAETLLIPFPASGRMKTGKVGRSN